MAKRQTKKSAKVESEIPGVGGTVGFDMPEVPGSLLPPGVTGQCPDRILHGRPNPEHWRWRMTALMHFDYCVMIGAVKAPRGWDLKKSSDALMAEAKSYGIDPKHLADVRTEAEKALDGFVSWLTNAESILEQTDEVLTALERAMDAVESMAEKDVMERVSKSRDLFENGVPDDPLGILGKARAILRRVRTLRDRARTEVPKVSALHLHDRRMPDNPHRDKILASVHTLRHLLYCYRSTVGGRRGADRVLKLGVHHVRICIDVWQAKERACFYSPTKHFPNGDIHIDRSKYLYEGAIEIAPPGHGKTTFVIGEVSLMICEQPDIQIQWLHAIQEEAEKNVEAVKAFFKPDNDVGRRCLSLYPHLRLTATGNGVGLLNIAADKPKRGVTLQAFAVTSKRAGSDCTVQILDDVVPQSDAREASERENRAALIAGTWIQRLRGQDTLRIVIGTMWHFDDALCRLFKKSRPEGGKKLNYVTRAQACKRVVGRNGHETFEALWPDEYPARRLKQLYTNMLESGNEDLWNYAYEANMQPESRRLIRKLRLYAADLKEHEVFCQSARGHVSADPTFTKSDTSDPAGIVVAMAGRVQGTTKDDVGRDVFAVEEQIRLHDAIAVPTTAFEMSDVLCRIIDQYDNIEECHIESNAGGHGIIQTLENLYGFSVTPHSAQKSKAVRLRRVMHMIDDSTPGRRACVLFPGLARRDECGNMVLDENEEVVVDPDPKWDWLYKQFLEFGFTSQDHILDAVTQVCNALSTVIQPGKGVVSRAIRRVRGELSAKEQYLKRLSGQRKVENEIDAQRIEDDWSRSNWE